MSTEHERQQQLQFLAIQMENQAAYCVMLNDTVKVCGLRLELCCYDDDGRATFGNFQTNFLGDRWSVFQSANPELTPAAFPGDSAA